MKIEHFEDIEAWQLAREFIKYLTKHETPAKKITVNREP